MKYNISSLVFVTCDSLVFAILMCKLSVSAYIIIIHARMQYLKQLDPSAPRLFTAFRVNNGR